MSSRTRAKRASISNASGNIAESSTSRSTRGGRRAKAEPEVEIEEGEEDSLTLGGEEALALGEIEDDNIIVDQQDPDEGEEEEEEDYEEPKSMKSRSARNVRGKGGKAKRQSIARSKSRGKAKADSAPEEAAEQEENFEDDDHAIESKPSRRLRKSVSYKEIPIEEPEDEDNGDDDEQGEDEDAEGEVEEEEEEVARKPRKRQPPVRLSSQTSNITPRKRNSRSSVMKTTPSKSAKKPIKDNNDEDVEGEDDDIEGEGEEQEEGDDDDDDDQDEDAKDTPTSRFEKIPGGSGRGGFSVKGAAAAAARARWDKVRREKIERGEDPDEPRHHTSSSRKPKRKRDHVVQDADHVEMDSTITVKGVEYKVGDDELILDDDEKGNAKVDAEGRLLGGREYKLVTFTSATRRNPEKLYTMTIDAARACGYSDSLAFLRRCPQILKLSCTAEERQLLIDIGRIAGNLKHRQVTMVSVRNVYKLMGARVVKGGKWVTDDYYEDESLEKCKEMGWEPGSLAEDEDLINQQQNNNSELNKLNSLLNESGLYNQGGLGNNQGERGGGGVGGGKYIYSLTPFYTIGGITTQFGLNNGFQDPFTDAGYGNKRQKLKSAGVTYENYLYLTSKESLRINQELNLIRNQHLKPIKPKNGNENDLNVWVYSKEKQTDQIPPSTNTTTTINEKKEESVESYNNHENKLLHPGLDRKRSGLSREVTRGLTEQLEEDDEKESIQPIQNDIEMNENDDTSEQVIHKDSDQPELIVEKPNQINSSFHWGLGSWSKGVVKAVYEPHTNTPHIPQNTQPTSSSSYDRLSYQPILNSSSSSQSYSNNSIKGISSVEYVFENDQEKIQNEIKDKEKQVLDAIEWEKQMRKKRRIQVV
ncbi:uncharacterized protein L201_004166 [Kwoniella dendrophila CBS 6074]|uniref:Uncharacterized protein n=1 Tax=Kwoniella dendrophila CBS 6074 TaxID=1295534 RepID=A0AAX4JUY3_9TREE